jgi:hypothetical protein
LQNVQKNLFCKNVQKKFILQDVQKNLFCKNVQKKIILFGGGGERMGEHLPRGQISHLGPSLPLGARGEV